MSTNKSIAKSAGVIGAATLISRLLGFIRDVVIAQLFGVYVYAQAFVIAFRIPNLFRDLLAEGASNAAFVPVFSEYLAKRSKQEFWQLVNVVLNLLLVILMVLTILGVWAAPVIVRLIAPGFSADPQKLAVTIRLSQIIFPYVMLISLSAYATAILNSLRSFAISAFAPCLLNSAIIICALCYGEGIKGLALGVLIGGLLQLAIQLPALYKNGFRLNLFTRFRHPATAVIGKLMLPRLLSSAIYQLNNFVDSIFGSFAVIVGEGGVAVLYFAYRLIQFPLGIFSNALAQALLPTLSTQALDDKQHQLKNTLLFGVQAVIFVMVPASVAFMMLSRPLIETLFGGGKFDAYAVNACAQVLFYYSIGLTVYAATKVVQSCFFAMKDTLTPTKISALALGLNIFFNVMLMYPMRIAGIALATSLSGLISFALLFSILTRRLAPFDVRTLWASSARIVCASLGMGLVCYYIALHIHFGHGVVAKVLLLGTLLFAGCVSYVGLCLLLRVDEMKQLLVLVHKRLKVA